jgi:MoxR-like ATPase
VPKLDEGLDEDFYWMISRMKNFDENNLFIFMKVLFKYDSKPWSPSRTEIMRDLIHAQYTLVKDLDEKDVELLDKRFQSHVSPMLALDLGSVDDDGVFHVSAIGRVLEKERNVSEFMTNQMLRWQLPNGSIRVKEKLRKWIDAGRCVIPFVLLIRVLVNLYEIDETESYLTNEEIVKFLMPIKSHDVDLTSAVQAILGRRQKGENLSISARESERGIEDLKILLSYFVGTSLCYIQEYRIIKFGGQQVSVGNVITLSIGKLDTIKQLANLKYSVFDFSTFDIENEFQKVKSEWFKYYGSIPSFSHSEPTQVLDDEPLPMPSSKAIQAAISEIKEKLLIEDSVVLEIISNLVSGKNVILTGPIGSGKTHLAILVPELAWKDLKGYYPEVVTATADWTTQDVIGGIFPKIADDKKVTYTIQKGCAYDTIWKNWTVGDHGSFKRSTYKRDDREYRGVWLIIDEFNRANIDRAFGEMFTSVEHGRLKVPTSQEEQSFAEVPIPKDYRIIGTLNTFDKHYLFRLSDALKRRFAFIEVLPPSKDKAEQEKYFMIKRALDEQTLKSSITEKIFLDTATHVIDESKSDKDLISLVNSAYEIMRFVRYTKNLGTSILISIARFVFAHSLASNDLENSLDLALRSNVIPQLENVSKWSLEAIKSFACENIVDFFKSVSPDSVDFAKYETEFVKLLRYLGKDKIRDRVDRLNRQITDEEEWKGYDPWAGKVRPKLPLLRRSLAELIEEIQLM